MTSPGQQAAVNRVRADRVFWRALVDEVGRERMLEPGPMGEWSFKDLAAHLGAWPPWPADLANDDYEAINAWFQERDQTRSLDDVLDDYDRSFERLAVAIEALPESVAHDPKALPWTEGAEAAVDVDFTEHLHSEHVPSIRAWLDRTT